VEKVLPVGKNRHRENKRTQSTLQEINHLLTAISSQKVAKTVSKSIYIYDLLAA
jgi:hypothetical protein